VKELLFGTPYLANLKLLHVLTRFLTHKILVSLSEERVVRPASQLRRRSYYLVFTFIGVWASIFCFRVGIRVFGIGSSSGIAWPMSQKIIDIGWLIVLVSCILFKLEIFRKENEVIDLMNNTTHLEKEAIDRGNSNPIRVAVVWGKLVQSN
jgi:hypothetical protein